MSMTGIVNGLNNLTHDNGAVKALRDLIVTTAFNDPELERFFTPMLSAHNGDKLGWIGEMEAIGTAGAGCDPEYKSVNQQFAEKTWDIGEYSAPLKWCYEEFKNTIAEYALKHGTNIGDITSTELMDVVIEPALTDAVKKMYWRLAWFGDKQAKNVSASGKITNGVNTALFTACDGLFKRLFAIGAANPEQVVTIAANSETTRAKQKSEILKPGVATAIVDNMLLNADSRIAENGGVLMMTKSLADALMHDLKDKHANIMPWEEVFSGVRKTEYDGVTAYSIGIWDRMIAAYEDNKTTLNLPHRAVFASPKQLLVGTPSATLMQDFDLFFDRVDRSTKAYIAGEIGTLVGEDDLVQMAY